MSARLPSSSYRVSELAAGRTTTARQALADKAWAIRTARNAAQSSSTRNRAGLGDDVGTVGVGRTVGRAWHIEAGVDGPELDDVGVGIGAA